MAFTAYLICFSGLLGSLGPWDTSYVCRVGSKLLEVPEVHVREGRDGHFRPFTFCKSVASSCSEGFGSSVKTLPTVATMRCTTKGGTANSARLSGGTGGPRMGSAEMISMTTSADNWKQPRLQSGTRPWTHTIGPRWQEQSGASASCAATGPGCFAPSLSPSSWETTSEGTSMRMSSGSLIASWPGSSTGQRTCQGLNWEGIMPESSLMFSDGSGLDCSSDMTWAGMQTAPLDQAPLMQHQETTDEYNYFWGQVQTTTGQASHGFPVAAGCRDLRHVQEQQGMGRSIYELNDFWQCSTLDFHANFQDFQNALLAQQHERPSEHVHEPAPVPSPAPQHANFSSTEATLLRRGEGWQSPRAAGSSGGAPCGRVGAKHAESGHKPLKAVKRAYKRACKRAQNSPSGQTWYRGGRVTTDELRSQYVIGENPQDVPKLRSGVISSKPGKSGKHVKFLSWNSGGLAVNNWDILQNWLQEHAVHICCIHETHWPMVQEWCNGKYHVFHSGRGRSGGLMTLVHTKLANRGNIRSGTLADGRIQHTRIYDVNGGIDIVNIYQRAWSHGSVAEVTAQRKKVWTALSQCLDSLPARNQVLVCGDMNTQLPFCRGATGTAVRSSGYRDTRDEHELLDILRLHGLVAINMFHDPKTFTYSGAGSQTQLDYIFMRSNQAAGLSKQAKGLHQFPLLAARGDGFHVPILARIPSRWRVWSFREHATQQQGPSKTETSIYINANPRILVPHLSQALQDGFTDIGSLDEALLQVQQCTMDTMQQRRDQALRPWQDGDLRETLRKAWMHVRQARSQVKKKLCKLFSGVEACASVRSTHQSHPQALPPPETTAAPWYLKRC